MKPPKLNLNTASVIKDHGKYQKCLTERTKHVKKLSYSNSILCLKEL